jgi:TPR repeat protein
MFNYGVLRGHYPDIGLDVVTAAHYYKLAGDQNYAPAHYFYARCLETGTGVAIDYSEALRYLKRAADHNYALAQ